VHSHMRCLLRLLLLPQSDVARAAAESAHQVAEMAERLAELQQQTASSAEFQVKREAQETELGALRDRLGRYGARHGGLAHAAHGSAREGWRHACAVYAQA
jgi:hypothetical protein